MLINNQISYSRALVRCVLVALLVLVAPLAVANPTQLPDGLTLVGLTDGEWHVYIAENGEFQRIDVIDAPRTVAYSHVSNRLAYVGSDNRLREYDLATQQIRLLPVLDETDRFTQPHYDASGQWLYTVQMPGGKSRRTSITGFDLKTDVQHAFVRKRTAQFEPFMATDGYLYYSTAICVDDCEGMIWELWRRNMTTGRQVQLTLTNALANQPYVSADGWLYFTSNADAGQFHIWRMRPQIGADMQQLTRGRVRDSDPVTDLDGTLYFLRRANGMTQLLRWRDGVESVVPLAALADLRNLEMGR